LDALGPAELTAIDAARAAALRAYPTGTRVIVRREHPHPAAQLDAFEERDGYRPTPPTPRASSWRSSTPATEPTPASRTTSAAAPTRLHRISAAIGPDNEPLIAVAKRLGMAYEGRLRHHVFTNSA